MLARRALTIALIVAAPFAAAGGAAAQGADDATGEPQTLDELIDFVIRPSQDAGDGQSDEDIWNWDKEEPSLIDNPVGPPLAGPTDDDPLGPPLAGPVPEPRPVRERRIPRASEDDPFAQRGIRLGSFIIRPSIEVGVTATDNAGGSVDKTPAVGYVVAPEVTVRSESERYEFEAGVGGESTTYDHSEFDGLTAEARAKLRYDLTSRSSIFTEAAYSHFLEGFSDPDTPGGAAERPAVDSLEASLGYEQRFGRFSARVTGFAERSVYEEVPLVGGGTASRKQLNNTDFGVRVRTGYATSASLRPFVEAAVGARIFDQSADDNGFQRSGVWGSLRGGLVIDRGDKLSGEASIGYRHDDVEDPSLEDVNVFLVDASILWSPRRLTEVRLDLSTSIDPTLEPNTSAAVLYSGTLTFARNLTPRIRAETGIGLSYESRVGDNWRDVTFTGFAGASYAFSRTASIEARYVYEHTDRNVTDGTYDSHEVGVRLRLQR